MSDETLWVRDLAGAKASVPAADRDRWMLSGWTETGEPRDGDFVWMEYPGDGVTNPGLVPWAARAYWQGIGWQASAPPEPVNPTRDPALTDVRPAEQPPDGNVDAVKDWVGDDPVRAEQALEAERERGRPRSTLVDALERVGGDDTQTSAAPAAPDKGE